MVSSAPVVSPTAIFTWTETTGPTSLLFPALPHPVSLLPSLFRVLAWSVIVPVAILALLDVFGWAYHIFILRPLGYASTIRFKDPEPSTLLNLPAKDAKVTLKPSPTSSPKKQRIAVSSHSSSRSRSPSHREDVRVASSSSSPNSSAASSPTIEYQDLSSPPTSRSPSHSPSSSSSTNPGLLSSSSSSHMTNNKTRHGKPPSSPSTEDDPSPRARSSSTSSHSSTSSMSSIYRERAGSIGVEGPLLFVGPGEELGSPRSDFQDELALAPEADGGAGDLSVDEDGSGGEDPVVGGAVRRRNTARGRGRMGVPRGGPSFGFTGMED